MTKISKSRENAKTLASLLNLDEESAMPLLSAHIHISWDSKNASASKLGLAIATMLNRTFENVSTTEENETAPDIELAVNLDSPTTQAARVLYCTLTSEGLFSGPPTGAIEITPVHPCLVHLAASFASAFVANTALGLDFSSPATGTALVDFKELLEVDASALDMPVDIGTCHLVGAGAIGDAFLYALSLFKVSGELVIIDPKNISEGNLNRCLWYEKDDVGAAKATTLAEKVRARLPNLKISSFVGTFYEFRQSHPGEISRMVVGVDSRLARRKLQEEMPYEVFDASTTGVSEVVFHHNQQLTGLACLACIYHKTEAETSHDHHIAEALNVSVDDVRTGFISQSAAEGIVRKYPGQNVGDLVGKAFDSLYKAMCAAAELKTAEEKQVLAPFSFVSQLGGTILAIELIVRTANGINPDPRFNYWRVSPWRKPNVELRAVREAQPHCSVCSAEMYQSFASQLWGAGVN